jgi:hypothetical protein
MLLKSPYFRKYNFKIVWWSTAFDSARAPPRARTDNHAAAFTPLAHLCHLTVVFPRNSDTLECITTVLRYSTCVNPPTANTHAQCIHAPRLRCRAQPTAAATRRCCCRAARIQRRTYPRIADPLALCSRLLRIQRATVSDPRGSTRPCSRAAPQQVRLNPRRSEA